MIELLLNAELYNPEAQGRRHLIAAGHFDRYIWRRDDGLRGRRPDEVPNLLRESLLAHGVPSEQVVMIPDELAATDAALHEAQAGDLLLLFADAITRSWKQVIQFKPEAPARLAERPRPSCPEPAPPVTSSIFEDGRREFVRDTRGIRIAGESDD